MSAGLNATPSGMRLSRPECSPPAVETASSACQTDGEQASDESSFSLERFLTGRNVAAVGCCVIVGLLLFTFLGAVEYGSATYYPITWLPHLGLPEPWAALRTVPARTAGVW